MAAWRYLAHDLRSNTSLGELPLTDVVFGEVLNGAGQFSASLSLAVNAATSASERASAAGIIAAASIPERTAVFIERDGAIVGGAIVWLRTRGKNRPAMLQGAGFWSFFRMQHLRTSKVFVAADQLAIVQDLVDTAQGVTGADIGVTVGVETSGVVRDRSWGSFEVKQIGEAVEQLAAVDRGFDFAVDVAPGPSKVLTLSYPRRGRIAGSTGIAFVDGKNLLDYEAVEDGSRSARSFTAVGAGDGNDMLLSTVTRTDLIDAGFPLTSAVGAWKDVSVQATLDAHARGAVNARAVTPMFWSLTVDPDDPDGGLGKFIVGDDALVEVPDDDNFPRQSDGSAGYRRFHRIVSWTVTVPSTGKETVRVVCGAA